MAFQQVQFQAPQKETGKKGRKSSLSEGLGVVGGVVGGAFGAIAGGGTANIPGAVVGGTAGAAGGATLGEKLGSKLDAGRADTRSLERVSALPSAPQLQSSSRTQHIASALEALKRQQPAIQQQYLEPLSMGLVASTAVDQGGTA